MNPLWRAFHLVIWAPIRHLLRWALALLIVFEEWGWEPLQAALARIGQWPGFRHLEAWIQRQRPSVALALFLAPTLALLPVKLLALRLITLGHGLLGLAVIVVAKLVGTGVVARLFTLTQPALMQLAWFAHWHGRWVAWKDSLLAQVRASSAWRWGRIVKRRFRRFAQARRHS